MQPNIDALITEGCSVLKIDRERLLSKTRKREVVDIRHLLILFIRELFKTKELTPETGYKTPSVKQHIICEKFDLKRNGSITHSVNKAKTLLEVDAGFREKRDKLKSHLIANGWEGFEC